MGPKIDFSANAAQQALLANEEHAIRAASGVPSESIDLAELARMGRGDLRRKVGEMGPSDIRGLLESTGILAPPADDGEFANMVQK